VVGSRVVVGPLVLLVRGLSGGVSIY
jgi:hypothetical protein